MLNKAILAPGATQKNYSLGGKSFFDFSINMTPGFTVYDYSFGHGQWHEWYCGVLVGKGSKFYPKVGEYHNAALDINFDDWTCRSPEIQLIGVNSQDKNCTLSKMQDPNYLAGDRVRFELRVLPIDVGGGLEYGEFDILVGRALIQLNNKKFLLNCAIRLGDVFIEGSGSDGFLQSEDEAKPYVNKTAAVLPFYKEFVKCVGKPTFFKISICEILRAGEPGV